MRLTEALLAHRFEPQLARMREREPDPAGRAETRQHSATLQQHPSELHV